MKQQVNPILETSEAIQKQSMQRSYDYRKRLLELSQKVAALHIAPTFSCLEIVDVIYHSLLRPVTEEKAESKRCPGKHSAYQDSFLLSKGHGAPALYLVLEKLGLLAPSELDAICTAEGRLGSHPDVEVPGVEASTGSLGHGLGMALGMAISDRDSKLDRHIYVLLSDGELQEGSTWEALLLAPSLKLTELTVCIDMNNSQSFAKMTDYHPNMYPLREKFETFGWSVAEAEGHDSAALLQAFRERTVSRPHVVIAKTTKGYPVSFMQDNPIWHYRCPNAEEYRQALADIQVLLPGETS